MNLPANPIEIDSRHLEFRNRPRRIIFNNDGCDVFTVPPNCEPTAEALLAQRTLALAGTQVDVLCYTTISSGFSLFTHDTQVGEVLESSHPALANNIAPALIRQGRDCLRIMVDFGHDHGMEVFWSMRMNDTHDGAHRPEKPYFLFPRLKQEHPEFLMGTPEARPRHGSWSAVDYGRPEIRDLAFRLVEEVCQRYDVDGIELDFFRHPVFFRSVAAGQAADPDDLEAMTGLLRQIRSMTLVEGKRRGRPLLLAVRTPDSVPYSRAMGLDLEAWMTDNLIDFWVPGGYFRLNPLTASVKQARRHGIRVWAEMSESRVGGGHHRDPGRASDACYRARALNAWDAGADGVYLFNLFDPNRSVWRELGDPDHLRSRERTYFVNILGRKNAAGGNLPYDDFRHLPDLNPDNPVTLPASRPWVTQLELSGIAPVSGSHATPKAQLRLEFDLPAPKPGEVTVVLNENHLPRGRPEAGELIWSLDPLLLRNGNNNLSVQKDPNAPPITLRDIRLDVPAEPLPVYASQSK